MSFVQASAPRGASEQERRRRLLGEMDAVINDYDVLYETHPMAITILMTEFCMQYLRELHKAFDGDMTMCLVLGEIGQANTRRFLQSQHQGGVPLGTAESGAVYDLAQACNGLSVSMASGIPRETVRRKIAALADMGWIAPQAGGWVATAEASRRFSPTFNRDLSRRLLLTAKRLLEL